MFKKITITKNLCKYNNCKQVEKINYAAQVDSLVYHSLQLQQQQKFCFFFLNFSWDEVW